MPVQIQEKPSISLFIKLVFSIIQSHFISRGLCDKPIFLLIINKINLVAPASFCPIPGYAI
jgi:hypothetical protein